MAETTIEWTGLTWNPVSDSTTPSRVTRALGTTRLSLDTVPLRLGLLPLRTGLCPGLP